jgi:hypothetical protein
VEPPVKKGRGRPKKTSETNSKMSASEAIAASMAAMSGESDVEETRAPRKTKAVAEEVAGELEDGDEMMMDEEPVEEETQRSDDDGEKAAVSSIFTISPRRSVLRLTLNALRTDSRPRSELVRLSLTSKTSRPQSSSPDDEQR